MSPNAHQLRQRANWDGAAGRSRFILLEKLRSKPSKLKPRITIWFSLHSFASIFFTEYVSSRAMLPERRLEQLILQAIELQKNKCLYHNTLDGDFSLWEDHTCAR